MTIWYDVTTTLRNRGRNGIANVEWSIGSTLVAGAADVRCFALDDRNGLVVIDAERVLGERGDGVPAGVFVGIGTGRPSVPRAAARAALAMLDRDDAAIAHRAVVGAYLRLKRARSSMVGRIRRSLPTARSVDLLRDRVSAGDVVISMGADWSGELADQLAALKQATACHLVTMVYDLIPLTHPHLAFHQDPDLFTAYYRRLVSGSDLITCISAQTERDLMAFAKAHGLTLPVTAVLRLGDGQRPPEHGSTPRRAHYLMVGTLERRKNLETIYDALRILESEGRPVPTVVVAGGSGWGVDDLLRELSLRTTSASRAIVLLGTVDDDALERMYGEARALLFPSHYEGWGLPLREAAVRGCPVAAADGPAVREALQDYPGLTVLPADDPGPWADYLRDGPSNTDPAAVSFVPWTATVGQLRDAVERAIGGGWTSSGSR